MRLVFDIEANGFLFDVSKVHCIEMVDPDTSQEYHFGPGQIREALLMLQEADEIIGHNIIKYDVPALRKLYPWWCPKGKIVDTIVLSQLIWPDLFESDATLIKTNKAKDPDFFFPGKLLGKHKLEAWGLRLGLLKGNFAEVNDFATWTPEMQEYCHRDVAITLKLFKLTESKRYPQRPIDYEHEFAMVIAKQEIHGFHFDTDACHKLVAEIASKRYEAKMKLQKLFPIILVADRQPWAPKRTQYQTRAYKNPDGTTLVRKELYGEGAEIQRLQLQEFNPGSREQIAYRLKVMFDWEPQQFTKSGQPEVSDEVLQSLPWEAAQTLGEYLMLDKRLGQISSGDNAWLHHLRDGRIHGSMMTNGAVTGRCTHYSPNMGQVPANHNPYGKECRSLFMAPAGFVLLGADASGLELRMLGHFLAKYDDGAFLEAVLVGDSKLRTDVHSRNLAAMQAAGKWFDGLDFATGRDIAKRFMYALIYGGGNAKLGKIVGGTAADGKKLREAFMSGIKGFTELDAAIKSALSTNGGWILGLDGRKLYSRSSHSALNLLLQSAGALIVKRATVLAHDAANRRWPWDGTPSDLYNPQWWAQVGHIHDEIQYIVRAEIAEEFGQLVVKAMKDAGEVFNMRVRIDAEYKVGKTWSDTH